EVRHRAPLAVPTPLGHLQKIEANPQRPKGVPHGGHGYDFGSAPKKAAPRAASQSRVSYSPRARASTERYSQMMGSNADGSSSDGSSSSSDVNPFSKSGNEFAAADLAAELVAPTREANRANVTMYTIDPRGLVGGPDLDETTLDTMDSKAHISDTQNSPRVVY